MLLKDISDFYKFIKKFQKNFLFPSLERSLLFSTIISEGEVNPNQNPPMPCPLLRGKNMINQYNPYYMPTYSQTLPQQQIPTANGRASADNIKLAPNSSVLVADSTLPIIYRCISDSLGNVTITSFDITPHKDEEQVKKEQTDVILADLVQRIERLEHESNTKWNNTQHEPDKADVESFKERKQPTGNGKPTDAKQS